MIYFNPNKNAHKFALVAVICIVALIIIFTLVVPAQTTAQEQSVPDSENTAGMEENNGQETAELEEYDELGEKDITSPVDGYQYNDYYGTLTIADTGIRVDLFVANVKGSGVAAQEITDAENSAALFNYGNIMVIADHNDQSFLALNQTEVGMVATITRDDGSVAGYRCIKSCKGSNNEDSITDDEGNDIAYLDEDCIAMYTCEETWENIHLTEWEPTNKETL